MTPRNPTLSGALRRLLVYLIPLLFCGSVLQAASVKLDLGPDNVVNELVIGDAGLLLDEQSAVGDPRAGTATTPTTVWFPGWTSWYWPVSAVIDLGGNCRIDDISFYDATASGLLEVEAKVGNQWVTVMTDPQNRWPLQWVTKAVNVTSTRYLRVRVHATSTVPWELVLYGERLEAVQVPPAVPHTPPTFDQFIGANAVNTTPMGWLSAVGTVREYQNWSWTAGGTSPAYPNEQHRWSFAWTGGWNFDRYYENLYMLGIEAIPCKKENVGWLHSNKNAKPILENSGRDPKLPTSYIEHATHLFQMAARYGSTTHPPSALKVAPDEPALSGLGTLRYIENGNEQDATWWGRAEFSLPSEYAALSSADADGHMGTMGPGVGIKTADPDMKLVMAGTAGIELDYIKGMKMWCDENRGGDFPWDVLNVHHYSNDGGGQNDTRTRGISPEEDDLRGRMEEVVDYRNRYLPGREVWITEFGYDVHPESVQRAPAIGSMSAEQTQGAWLIRSYLELAAAGVDRAHMYMMEDASTGNGTKYATSGLVTDKASGSVPRPSWFYVKTMRERLRGLRYHSDQPSGHPDVSVYRFADANGTIKAYAVWCHTSEDKVVSNYSLPVTGTGARLVTLQHNQPVGVETPLTINGGAVSLTVRETPVFITMGTMAPMHLPDTHFPLTVSMVTNEAATGNPGLLVDEQAIAATAPYSVGQNLTTHWFPGYGGSYPASCYVDLGEVRAVSSIYLNDSYNTGILTVSAGSPGNWEPILADPLRHWRVWTPHVVNIRTRYLRFTMSTLGAQVFEAAVFVNPTTVPSWQQADIGAVGATGTMSENSGVITLQGAGRIATWYNTDALSFASQQVTGDFTLTAKVESMSSVNGKAMLMARSTLDPGSPLAATALKQSIGGVSLWSRTTANTNPVEGTRASSSYAPRWLRLKRLGNVFTAYHSTNGTSWSQVGAAQTVPLPALAEVGLGMTSDTAGTLREAQFSNITLTTP